MSDPVKLLPCPFCGGQPSMDELDGRRGTPRQSCIVTCLDCGASHESSDEGDSSGTSWNRRVSPSPAAFPDISAEIDTFARSLDEAAKLLDIRRPAGGSTTIRDMLADAGSVVRQLHERLAARHSSDPAPPSPWPSRPPEFNRWYADAPRFLAFVQRHPEAWCRDGRLKYLNVRVDTRSCHFRVFADQEHGGAEISPDAFVAASKKDRAAV